MIFAKKSERILIKNATVDGARVSLLIEDGRIAEIAPTIDGAAARVIDIDGQMLVPGLIDVHVHGCMGMESSDGSDAQVAMSRYFAEHGTTSWYPTGTTLGVDTLRAAFSKIPETPDGANIVGYHLEGPYVSYRYRGAQNPDFIRLPTLSDFEDVEPVKLITLAPEIEGAEEYIRDTRLLCVVGHTEANYETAMRAFKAGAKCVTHLFNAMPGLHHREPSVLGAAYDSNAYVQIISDGTHIHPSVIRMTYRLFGAERMILISDAIRPALLADGQYTSGGLNVTVKNGEARLADGTLAGSSSSLYRCVRQAIAFGIPPRDAFRMASETPAAMMGLRKGRIAVGYDAEFLVLDQNWEKTEVMILNK